MPERWLTQLRKIDHVEPSHDLMERAERGPSLPEPAPSRSRRAGIAVFALLLSVAAAWGAFAGLRGSERGPAGGPENFTAVWPETSLADAQKAQAQVDAGDPDVQWRTDAAAVALRFAEETLGWPDPVAGVTATDDPNTVKVSLHGPDASCQGAECSCQGAECSRQTIVNVTLQRLVRSGDGGIWSVTSVSGGEKASPAGVET
jgi:hypothetical protein